jgi:hypothetical protein
VSASPIQKNNRKKEVLPKFLILETMSPSAPDIIKDKDDQLLLL